MYIFLFQMKGFVISLFIVFHSYDLLLGICLCYNETAPPCLHYVSLSIRFNSTKQLVSFSKRWGQEREHIMAQKPK